MSIIGTVMSWFTPTLDPGTDGIFDFTDVRSAGGLTTLIQQIHSLPHQEGIDKQWMIDSLEEILKDYDNVNEFVELYQKIGVGRKLNYEGDPAGLVEQLKIMYPDVIWDGEKAINYRTLDTSFQIT